MTDQSALAVILGTALITLVAALAGEQLLLGLCRILGVYAVVAWTLGQVLGRDRRSRVNVA